MYFNVIVRPCQALSVPLCLYCAVQINLPLLSCKICRVYEQFFFYYHYLFIFESFINKTGSPTKTDWFKDSPLLPRCMSQLFGAKSARFWRGAADREASVSSPWIDGEAARGWGHVTRRGGEERWHWLIRGCWPDSRHRVAQLEGGTGVTRARRPRALN